MMKLKLIILLLIYSIQIFGQQSLHIDSVSSPQKSHVTKAKKTRKKTHSLKRKAISDTVYGNSTVAYKGEEETTGSKISLSSFLIVLVLFGIGALAIKLIISEAKRNSISDTFNADDFISDTVARSVLTRRSYYNDVYLKSDAWRRKRYVVLKRDNWRCVHCGSRATQVHHTRYAPKNIGKEPIEWLESICHSCHERIHQ